MPRPKIPAGQHGRIDVTAIPPVYDGNGTVLRKKHFIARARFGGADGRTRIVQAKGETSGSATRNLQNKFAELRATIADTEHERGKPTGPTVRDLAEKWWSRKAGGERFRRHPHRLS